MNEDMTWQKHMTKAEAKKFNSLKSKRDESADEFRAYRLKVKSAVEARLRKGANEKRKGGLKK